MTRPYLTSALTAAALACLTVLPDPAWATVTFDWATVGNPGNAAEPATGFGAVATEYRIAKTEVTNGQYTEFLNAKAASDPNSLYSPAMGAANSVRGGITRSGSSGSFTYATKANMANKPVNYVSFFDSMRFTNWLHNGQGAGSTETGVYNITNGFSETRDPNASYFLPSEDEWFKAAYHQPASQGGNFENYWLYPTASNSAPTIATANSVGDISNPGTNVANYSQGAAWNGITGNLTTVGSAGPGSASFYGTFDQGGNVFEWIKPLVPGSAPVLRGGAWSGFLSFLSASVRFDLNPSTANDITGFRVASPVPAAIAGDLDGNGFVDILDLNIILANWNTTGSADPRADTDGNGLIDILDLNVVLTDWNMGSPPPGTAGTSVPEPGTLAALGLGVPLLLRRRRG